MNLCERLKQLVGHSVAVDITGEEDDCGRLKGILREVGEDYIMIMEWDSIGGSTIPGECFVNIDEAGPIFHTADCRQCSG